MDMRYIDLISAFKKQEQTVLQNVVVLMDEKNKELRDAFLAWQSMISEYDSDARCPEQDAKRQWRWLWENTKFDMKQYAIVANVNAYDAPKHHERLKSLRLIYPDGTVHSIAVATMFKKVFEMIPKEAIKAKDDNSKSEQKDSA